LYSVLIIPFFLSGVILAYVFSAYPARIRSLYFWDLTGAAVGCVVFLPFLGSLGPGGLMFWAAAVSMIASGLFAATTTWTVLSLVTALALFVVPLATPQGHLEFRLHADKRGVRAAQAAGRIEFSRWDPISKIDVVDQDQIDSHTGLRVPRPKHVAYDGGSQSSHFFPFNGDYQGLRRLVLDGSGELRQHFWTRGVLASHYLKRDTGARVLIFGTAAGQETKAALLFGAGKVDGVELVDAVVQLGQGRYSAFIGGIFRDPRVHNQVGEGRSYLRASSTKYDIIQIFSNHTSSNIAVGSGATTPVYLQTVDAYREYFGHLKEHGVLHVNHHFYPRMIMTAARAWKEAGRSDFQRHVIVFERRGFDTLPTMLVKLSPWTDAEVKELETFFGRDDGEPPGAIVVHPLAPAGSFLSEEFFSGAVSAALRRRMDYDVRPSTDDWPYFNNIQNGFERVTENPGRFLNESMAVAVNGRLGMWLGEYFVFAVAGGGGLLFSAVVLVVPLMFTRAGLERWPGRKASLLYFSCLGAGFIMLEVGLVQVFLKLVGFPLYTFSVVIFTMLLGAGLGSMAAERLSVSPRGGRWTIPFVGILVTGATLLAVYPAVIDACLTAGTVWRVVAAMLTIFPLAFFLGMPFPLGILALELVGREAIAWAWGANAVWTVIGGVAAGLLSMLVGFRLTLLLALIIYLVAFAAFVRLRRAAVSDGQSIARVA
jgi:spermidine synthase